MVASMYNNRAARFERLRNNKPQTGEVLYPKNGEPITIMVERKLDFRQKNNDGSPVEILTLYCNAAIDEAATGWYLVNDPNGLRCLLIQGDHRKLFDRFKGDQAKLRVNQLRVLRENRNKTALICELMEEKYGGN